MTPDDELLELIAEHQTYLERLVMILWEWGDGDLFGIDQPDTWQIEFLADLGVAIRKRNFDGVNSCKPIKVGRGSGRQAGKSALVGMVIVILSVAFPDAKITVTANTDNQLDTKTWPEILSWLKLSIVAHWFDSNSQLIWRKGARDTWFTARVNWNLENTQAFAGQGNRRSINVVIYDEASTIPHKIWDVTMGGLSSGLPIFMAFGNLTEPTGDFHDAMYGPDKPLWDSAKCIDTRTCRFPNQEKIAEEVARYGEDSDYVRVWIRGLPPKTSLDQYFPSELIVAAQARKPKGMKGDALIASCDLSWGGSDPSRIAYTHGLDAWSLEALEIPGEQTADPEKMVSVLAGVLAGKHYPAGCPEGMPVTHLFMDAAGSANVIAQRLRDLGFRHVTLVNFAGHAINMKMDKNIRSEMVRKLKEYMEAGAGIGIGKNLEADLRNIQKIKTIPLQFEDKDLIRKRLKRSTDSLDALMLTRYAPVVLPEVHRQALGYVSGPSWAPASPYS